jgi:hypothetical protein
MHSFLARFVESGNLTRQDVWRPVIETVNSLLLWLSGTSTPFWHMYSASLLVTYDAAATDAAKARVCCNLIDFAHTSYGMEDRDANFQEGLHMLLAILLDLISKQADSDCVERETEIPR